MTLFLAVNGLFNEADRSLKYASEKRAMKQDRFLMVIVGIIGLLVTVALILFFVRRNSQNYQPDDTPEGVVHNYVLALNLEDYEKAYSYLAASDRKPDLDEFEREMIEKRTQLQRTSIRILSTQIEDNQAEVILSITRELGDPFEPPRSYEQKALLIFQVGTWKLTQMPYYLWY